MTIWPDTLPQAPLADGFRETVPETALRSDMDQGPAKVRPRTTTGVRRIAMQFIFSAADIEVLDDFFINDLTGGALPFDFTHPRTNAAINCRFVKPPEYLSLNGLFYKAGIELEILP